MAPHHYARIRITPNQLPRTHQSLPKSSFAFSPMGTDSATKGGGNNRKPLQTAEKPTPWKVSEGKKYLERELKDDGSHLHQMSIKDIHSSDNRFSVYPLKNFTTNFRNLKKRIEATRARVELDNKNVSEHKKMYPRGPKTKRGYPHWNGHPAKAKLVKDVRNGTAEKMLPSKLRETRKSYKEFPVDVFTKRVHAEKSKQMADAFWVQKRNRKALKQHLKDSGEQE